MRKLLSKREDGSRVKVCKAESEQTSRFLEQCSLNRGDQSGEVCPQCAAACLEKTAHTNCQHRGGGVMIWAPCSH